MRKITFEEFEKRALEKHNGFYSYVKESYVNTTTKMEIICPIHGSFSQEPEKHIHRGQGCWKCKNGGPPKLLFEEFENRSKEIHSGFYTYVKSTYTKTKDKTEIICPIHGSFWQTPSHHMNGDGCKICNNKGAPKILFKDFEIKAKSKHNNLYSYNESSYVNMRTKFEIICPIHGSFWQTPTDHIHNGHGCQKCAGNGKMLFYEFYTKSNKVHEGFYSYIKDSFINAKSETEIICPIHGIFKQIPYLHMKGHGCKKCNVLGAPMTTFLEFEKRSKEIHHGFYSYPDKKEGNSYTIININCPKHGLFHQSKMCHLRGYGCSSCAVENISKMETEVIRLFKLNDIIYERRKTYSDLIDKGLLSYDFYLPDFRTLLECNGIQHDEPVDYFGGLKTFVKQFKHDTMKIEYALKIQERLLIINHNQNVGEFLLKAGIINRLK